MQGSRFSLTSSSVYSEGTDMRINQLKEPGVLSCVHRIDTTFMISQHQHQCIVCGILYECKNDEYRIRFQHDRCLLCKQVTSS
jgi:hypothetical protein